MVLSARLVIRGLLLMTDICFQAAVQDFEYNVWSCIRRSSSQVLRDGCYHKSCHFILCAKWPGRVAWFVLVDRSSFDDISWRNLSRRLECRHSPWYTWCINSDSNNPDVKLFREFVPKVELADIERSEHRKHLRINICCHVWV